VEDEGKQGKQAHRQRADQQTHQEPPQHTERAPRKPT
jgi:hypothetical protein